MPIKIVVADYEKKSIEEFQEIFTNGEFQVLGAADGALALEAFRSEKPDLVLASALLPKINGFELCRRISSGDEGFVCPVIIFSGIYKAEKYRKEAIANYGASEFLEKPLSRPHLMGVVRQLLQSRDAATKSSEPFLAGHSEPASLLSLDGADEDKAVDLLEVETLIAGELDLAAPPPSALEPDLLGTLLIGTPEEMQTSPEFTEVAVAAEVPAIEPLEILELEPEQEAGTAATQTEIRETVIELEPIFKVPPIPSVAAQSQASAENESGGDGEPVLDVEAAPEGGVMVEEKEAVIDLEPVLETPASTSSEITQRLLQELAALARAEAAERPEEIEETEPLLDLEIPETAEAPAGGPAEPLEVQAGDFAEAVAPAPELVEEAAETTESEPAETEVIGVVAAAHTQTAGRNGLTLLVPASSRSYMVWVIFAGILILVALAGAFWLYHK